MPKRFKPTPAYKLRAKNRANDRICKQMLERMRLLERQMQEGHTTSVKVAEALATERRSVDEIIRPALEVIPAAVDELDVLGMRRVPLPKQEADQLTEQLVAQIKRAWRPSSTVPETHPGLGPAPLRVRLERVVRPAASALSRVRARFLHALRLLGRVPK